MDEFTRSYQHYGIIVQPDNSISCLEWAPGAEGLSLVGDFNNWNLSSHPYSNIGYGKWELKIPANGNGSCPITSGSIIKVAIKKDGVFHYKLSPWVNLMMFDVFVLFL